MTPAAASSPSAAAIIGPRCPKSGEAVITSAARISLLLVADRLGVVALHPAAHAVTSLRVRVGEIDLAGRLSPAAVGRRAARRSGGRPSSARARDRPHSRALASRSTASSSSSRRLASCSRAVARAGSARCSARCGQLLAASRSQPCAALGRSRTLWQLIAALLAVSARLGGSVAIASSAIARAICS